MSALQVDEAILTVSGLAQHFPMEHSTLDRLRRRPRPVLRAVDGVDLVVGRGETVGLVGESGCGKSTLARCIVGLYEPTAGEVRFGTEVLAAKRTREQRRHVQMVFQDPYSSLNPRLTVQESIAFAPQVHGVGRRAAAGRASDLLAAVGLNPAQFGRRYPHELSGGQRQRVNIARALALQPRLLILDEPVSALDKSVEAQVLNLLLDLKAQFALTYLFISHDLNVVQFVADRVLVMYLGRIAEIGPVDDIFGHATHPYTAALLDSRPSMDPDRRRTEPPLFGDPPNPVNPPSGCRFRTRCRHAEPACADRVPPLVATARAAAHQAACLMALPGSGHSQARAA